MAGTCALVLSCAYVRVPCLMAALVMKPLMEGLFTSAYTPGMVGRSATNAPTGNADCVN